MKACRGFRPKWEREKFLKVQSVLQSNLTERKLEVEYVKLKCPYLPSHFFRCYFKIKGRIEGYNAISCAACYYGKQIGSKSKKEGRSAALFVRMCEEHNPSSPMKVAEKQD